MENITIQEIREELKGYHLEIMIYPTGGKIEAAGCEECGTDDSQFEVAGWKLHKGETIFDAIDKIKRKLAEEQDND